jgi:hypothetical protein
MRRVTHTEAVRGLVIYSIFAATGKNVLTRHVTNREAVFRLVIHTIFDV